MQKFFTLLITYFISLTLTGCSDNPDYTTPAQTQIDEYNSQLEECQGEEGGPPALKGEVAKTSQTPPPPGALKQVVIAAGFNISKNDMVLGNPAANTIVIEYFGPTCPHCAYYHKNTFPELKKKYIDTNKIAYVMREFISNKLDLEAAILARCNGKREDFFKFINIILDKQDNWALSNKYRDILTNLGQIGGIPPEQYLACLNNDDIAQLLVENTKIAAKAPKFIGTPAFFINGHLFTGAHTTEGFSKAIEGELNKAD